MFKNKMSALTNDEGYLIMNDEEVVNRFTRVVHFHTQVIFFYSQRQMATQKRRNVFKLLKSWGKNVIMLLFIFIRYIWR